jgi:hypothetical protein
MSHDLDSIVDDYLEQLDRELRGLSRGQRREVVAEVAEHIETARAEEPVESEAELRRLLDRVGAPEEIGAEARDRFGVRPARPHALEIAAIILLLLGGFLLAAGWFAGAVLLWTSRAWTTRDKLIGTLVVPGGLATSLLPLWVALQTVGGACTSEAAGGRCSGGTSSATGILVAVAAVAVALAPIATAFYLGRRLRRIEAEGSVAAAA